MALDDQAIANHTSVARWSSIRVVVAISALLGLLTLGYFRNAIIQLADPILSMQLVDDAINQLTGATLMASAGLLRLFQFDVYTVPAARELGMDDFHVYVWGPCSGIEGFGLISLFLGIYLWMFRKSLRFPTAFILIPIGIGLSWCLNVVRISVLLFIGARISPELAIDTFHSHAGWLMFTILAAGLTGATSIFGWFRKPAMAAAIARPTPVPGVPAPSVFADANIATIIPFIIFMASAFLLQAFTATPEMYYPWRVIAMFGGLLLITPFLRDLDWRPMGVPILVGLGIGAFWLVTTPAQSSGQEHTVLSAMSLTGGIIWVFARTFGTVLLVPIIEELFFRGYVLRKLDTGSLGMRIVAIIVSSAAFAILHERWLAAFLAGIVFALIFLRRHRLSDAIYAHASANGLIAGYAIFMQDWTVI